MIFITLGTDHHPFKRVINWIDKLYAENKIDEEVIIQSGYTPIPIGPYKSYKILSFEEMAKYITSARAVITHGSSTAILICRLKKKPIVIPRIASLGEHIDDHQVNFINKVGDSYPFYLPNSYEELASILASKSSFKLTGDELGDTSENAKKKFREAFDAKFF